MRIFLSSKKKNVFKNELFFTKTTCGIIGNIHVKDFSLLENILKKPQS